MNTIRSFEEIFEGRRGQVLADLEDWNENQRWFVEQFIAINTPANRQLPKDFIGLETRLFQLLQPCLSGAALPGVHPELKKQLLDTREQAVNMLAEISLLYDRFSNLPDMLLPDMRTNAEEFTAGSAWPALVGLCQSIPILKQLDDLILKLLA